MSPISPSPSAAQFYSRRSDRTARCLDGRLPPTFRAVITVATGWESIPATTSCLETLGNLLSRFCPQVTFVLSSLQAQRLKLARGLTAMRAADPFGQFDVTTLYPPHDIEVRLGGGTTKPASQISFSFEGWTARVSGQPSAPATPPDAANYHAAGAELAACLAGAAAFRFWIERTTAGVNPFVFDLFNLDERTGANPSTAPRHYDPRHLV